MAQFKWLVALAGAFWLAIIASNLGAQGRDTPTADRTGPPSVGNPPGKNVPPGKEHAGVEELYKTCIRDLQKCSEDAYALRQQVKTLGAQVAQLKKDTALPVCLNKLTWKHPKIADVSCYPYVCASNPFGCLKSCSSKLDCAPGRTCTADGLCAPPIN